MDKRRVYISGPITNNPDFKLKFGNAEKHLKKSFDSVVNPAEVCSFLPMDLAHDEYMRVCFAMMDLCDCVYFLKEWKYSNGARQEMIYAKNRGMEIFYESTSDRVMPDNC